MSSARSVLVVAAGILGIVVLGAVVVLLAEGREPRAYQPGSPEAAMQAYLTAWHNDDPGAAYDSLSSSIKATVSREDYVAQSDAVGGVAPNRATFIDRAQGDAIQVTVFLTQEEYYGDGFGETYSSQRSVRMVHEDGWKIDELLVGLEPAPFPAQP
ncbi:MAG TPA: hypothetical protein VIH33_01455 [Candidatus Limnocylindria bacterium]|jgi:hypothetical protein